MKTTIITIDRPDKIYKGLFTWIDITTDIYKNIYDKTSLCFSITLLSFRIKITL